jgi:hypothetical protein
MSRTFESFDEFWEFYVKEHTQKGTRRLHFLGVTAAAACVAGAVIFKKRWLLFVAPVVGYVPAWIGHFFIEKNMPASFKYPLWSLRADLVMCSKMATGTMDAEVQRVLAGNGRAKSDEVVSGEAPATTPTTN